MIPAIIYIGVSQSIFGALLMFLKKPLSIADKILGSWLLVISLMFVVNMLKLGRAEYIDSWPLATGIVITFPQFLYLYSKYITNQYNCFVKKDLLHFLPFLFSIILLAIYFDPDITGYESFANHYKNLLLPRAIIGNAFIICLWVYSVVSYIKIYRYRKQIGNVYSFESKAINLNWLAFFVVSFFIVYLIIIIASTIHIKISTFLNVELFRSGSLLLFVYILTVGGLKQHQLIFENSKIDIKQVSATQESSTNRYQKSGLKDDEAESYLKKLIDFMNQSEAWKDNELSVAKLSEQTEIPKHHITQILNENLQKNFYTFVNEYRTEYAKNLIASPKYENWSFLAIAYECGFNSKTAFNNFFKKYTNMTPTEYKSSITTNI